MVNNGFYGEKRFLANTDAAGQAVFQGLGKGSVSAYSSHPVTHLRGSGNGTLDLEGQTLNVVIRLEDSGQIHGRVLRSDGVTPAVEALVVVVRGGRTLQTLTDAEGLFAFASVPLGSFSLNVQEHLAPGKITRGGTVAANGQVVDAGTLVLDDEDPRVNALEPFGGSRDLPLSSVVVVRFNERLDRTRFTTGWVSFRSLAGQGVACNVAWADNDATLVLTPTAPLVSFTGYEVVVNDAWDPAGRRLFDRAKTVFYTVDVVPPTVVDVLPRNGQLQVPLDAQIKVTFSEPVTFASLSGTAFQLTDLTSGQGVTTTFLHLFGEREVLLTPASALASDHQFQLTVQSVRDNSGNTMAVPVTTTFWSVDMDPPQIVAIDFPAGTSFHSGDEVPVAVQATDRWGVKKAVVRVTGWTFADESEPFLVKALAPRVTAESDVALTIEVTDVHGNVATAARTIHVSPRVNANAPQVDAGCAREGTAVVAGIPAEFRAVGSDDEAIESFALAVDGTEIQRVAPVGTPQGQASFLWTPPAGAAPGTHFAIRLEARDFAGNVGTREFNVVVPQGTVLVGGRAINSSYSGQALTLAGGTFTLVSALEVPSLTLVRGARLVSAQTNGSTRITVQGELAVQCGAVLDAGAGFKGGQRFGQTAPGEAPAGVAAAQPDAGGSHGGNGGRGNQGGAPGAVYGSVYQPLLGGGGGSQEAWGDGRRGGNGGGVLDVTAGTLTVNGEIRSRGESRTDSGAGGAGGSVRVNAAVVRGVGLIDASGGDHRSAWQDGAGGGGRVALYAGQLDGFDPATQLRAWGGSRASDIGPVLGYAAPGTILAKTPGQTYGTLILDAGQSAGVDRLGAATELPALGTGTVATFTAAGDDAWVSAAAPFGGPWNGAWMTLLNAAGTELGTFRVLRLDTGKALLAGAGTVSGAATYRGEYRFDVLETRHGAGLVAHDPVTTGTAVFAGDSPLTGELHATTVTVKSGAVVRPLNTPLLRLVVSGKLTVEAGGRIDATARATPAATRLWPGAGARTDRHGGLAARRRRQPWRHRRARQ